MLNTVHTDKILPTTYKKMINDLKIINTIYIYELKKCSLLN